MHKLRIKPTDCFIEQRLWDMSHLRFIRDLSARYACSLAVSIIDRAAHNGQRIWWQIQRRLWASRESRGRIGLEGTGVVAVGCQLILLGRILHHRERRHEAAGAGFLSKYKIHFMRLIWIFVD